MAKPVETQELVPSVSIDNLLAQRNAIVERLKRMAELHAEIEELSKSAFGNDDAAPALECRRVHASLDTDHGLARMIKRVDATAWQHLMSESGLRTFMDGKAREQWDKALYEGRPEDVPALTLETIWETFRNLNDQRGEMFERGVVSCFRQLSWDYKTNSPYLFGKRIILERVLDIWNASASKRYSSGPSYTGCNRLDDLLRVMMVLDGQPELDHRQGAYNVLREYFSYDRHSTEPVELAGMVSIKCYKNGNGHVTFLRPDLVEKLNEIITRHHPNALPAKRP
jgi:hypothetical protein